MKEKNEMILVVISFVGLLLGLLLDYVFLLFPTVIMLLTTIHNRNEKREKEREAKLNGRN